MIIYANSRNSGKTTKAIKLAASTHEVIMATTTGCTADIEIKDLTLIVKRKIMKKLKKTIIKDKTLKVDINIKQTPVSANYECPHCDEEVEIDYNDFCIDAGEYCDWQYTKIECPNCGKTVEIDSVDWN